MKKVIIFPVRMIDMIKELKNIGYPTDTAVIHQAIIEMYRKNYGKQPKKDPKEALCRDVHGGVVEIRDGEKVCVFKVDGRGGKKVKNEVPLKAL